MRPSLFLSMLLIAGPTLAQGPQKASPAQLESIGESAGKLSDSSIENNQEADPEITLKISRSLTKPGHFLVSFCSVKTKACRQATPEPGLDERTFERIESQLHLHGTAFWIANNGMMIYSMLRVKARLADMDEISRQRRMMQNSLICDLHFAAIADAKKAEMLGLKEVSKDIVGVLGIFAGLNGPDPEKPRTLARKLKEARRRPGKEISLNGLKGLPPFFELSRWLALPGH